MMSERESEKLSTASASQSVEAERSSISTTASSQLSPPMSTQLMGLSLKPGLRVSPLKAKLNQRPLQINTYSTIFESSESASIVKKTFVPESASKKERDIHEFLNKMSCFTVNVKFKLEEDAKTECQSPKLQ